MLARRIRYWLRSARHARDLHSEIELHIEEKAAELRDLGLNDAAARVEARRRFGNIALNEEHSREVWIARCWTDLWRDLIYGARTLGRTPHFTAVTILTIAIAVGANTAIFSLIDALLLDTLPVRNPEELVIVRPVLQGQTAAYFPKQEYTQLRDLSEEQIQLFATGTASPVLAIGNDIHKISAMGVEGRYYELMGVRAFLGRLIAADDDREGAEPVVVLSQAIWRLRFGKDPGIVGKKIMLSGFPFTVIGIAPPGFVGTFLRRDMNAIVPLTFVPRIAPLSGGSSVTVEGRLRPGVSIPQAQAALTGIYQGVPRRQGEEVRLEANSQGDNPLRVRFRKPLYVLMGAVFLLLLIASANVANLLIARSASRQREIAVRLAIGAGGMRIVRQLLTESSMIALFGGLLGVGIAYISDSVLLSILGDGERAIPLDLRPDWHVLGFTLAVSLLTGVFFGLLPALQAIRTNLHPTLKETAGIAGGRRSQVLRALIVVQVALAVVLLAGAGLFLQTLMNLRSFDAGYNRQGVLMASFDPAQAGYSREKIYQFLDDLLLRVRALPGVEAAAIASTPVLSQGRYGFPLTISGRSQRCETSMTIASDGYFQSVGMRLLAGRDFTARDDIPSGPAVVIVNEEVVRRCFDGENPIGRRVHAAKDADYEIVGVVENAKYHDLREGNSAMYYVLPHAWNPYGLDLHVRTAADPLTLTVPLQREMYAMDSRIPLTDIHTLDEQSERSLSQDRLLTTVCEAFGLIALTLASIGIYGVLAFVVARRTSEIGLRMALGAGTRGVLWLVLRESVGLVLSGAILGIGGALAVSRYIESLLFGINGSDLRTLAVAAGVLLTSAVMASFIPAIRATRIDPVIALRHE